MHRLTIAAAATLAGLLTAAAPAISATPPRPGFHARVTNPWFPLAPGMRWVYRGVDSGRPARDVVRVTDRVAMIDGMPSAVLADRLYIRGRLAERTTDWYTEDPRGRVLYAGEATAELDRRGRVRSTEGSWRAGVKGARAGVFMPRQPRVGQRFQQEYAAGVGEDHFSVTSLHASAATPFATFAGHVLQTRETTPLEPGVVDRKLYVDGIGQIAEESVKGGHDRLRLVSFRSD
ncbi:MAG: hypothetical protein QOK21_2003 [Solirubrobacteraceae bacterium]|nr:hypothetical protein [Solirubrobacteraceae bacterium]